MIKKYFKRGLGTILPSILVVAIFYWLYGIVEKYVKLLLPTQLQYQWWYVLVFVTGLFMAIMILGVIFTYLTPIKWIKDKVEKYLLKKVPGIKQIYEFGQEITDSFLTDIKDDGNLKVVEVKYAGRWTLGLMTDIENKIIFIPTAPNPINGFVFKLYEDELDDFREVDIQVTDFLKVLTSLGKIGGAKW